MLLGTCSTQNLQKPVRKEKKCEHGKRKRVCHQCDGSALCIHKKLKYRCRECDGSELCIHKKRKTDCRECNGSSICIHNKVKYRCRECDGSAFCVHNKLKYRCRECDGSALCIHKKVKAQCRECHGSVFCIHNKVKYQCRECHGSAFCIHKKRKTQCRECHGSRFCVHDKRKSECSECGGSQICRHCKDWPDARRGSSQYDGYCATCFKHLWPNDPRSKLNYEHTKELAVRAFLDTNFQDFVHDTPMHTKHCDCSHRRRVDHRRVVGNTLLCIETDEHHHRGYDQDDEQARYHDVLMAWGGKLCFLRFNPDGRGPPLEERLERLRAEVTRHVGRLERGENKAFLEVHHLYYPEGTPDFYERDEV